MYLYGASGHAKVIIDILKLCNEKIDGLIDDNESVNSLLDYPVYHTAFELSPMIISIGNNTIRKTISKKLSCVFGKAIHPSAIISSNSHIDEGTVVMPGVIINSGTHIGKHCIINTCASIDHECVIEDFVHISPHATLCGNVSVGEGTWIGAGVVIIQGIKIGKWSQIGAGSVVTKDIPDNVLAFGNNCKIIRYLS